MLSVIIHLTSNTPFWPPIWTEPGCIGPAMHMPVEAGPVGWDIEEWCLLSRSISCRAGSSLYCQLGHTASFPWSKWRKTQTACRRLRQTDQSLSGSNAVQCHSQHLIKTPGDPNYRHSCMSNDWQWRCCAFKVVHAEQHALPCNHLALRLQAHHEIWEYRQSTRKVQA